MAHTLGLQKGIIYGPVNSRRLGRSLGLNIMPTASKLCPFNCIYCHYGWTTYVEPDASGHLGELPSAGDVKQALERALPGIDPPPAFITFSGNGESTVHPEFERIVEAVAAVRDRSGVDAKVAILSNSCAVTSEKVRRALGKLDVRIMKLDAGNQEVFEMMNRPAPGITLGGIVEGLETLDDVTLQSMFVQGEVTNAADAHVDAWFEKVAEIEPVFVQVYSIENAPAMSTLEGVPREKLEAIVERLETSLGIEARAY
jgi:wyosine [tRNA(Phe)-imidazoG37] synthetase (radical SAM superfamily)